MRVSLLIHHSSPFRFTITIRNQALPTLSQIARVWEIWSPLIPISIPSYLLTLLA